MRRFERLGELSDVDHAIDCHTQAVPFTPDSHPHKPSFLNNLGTSYIGRFERLSELSDLDYAIECQTEAVQLTPDGHPHKPGLFNNLGSSYMRRFERLGKLSDVDHAIDCQIQALELAPDGHPDKPSQLNNLGNSYMHRFERLGVLSDADNAIECQTQVVKLTPDGHPDEPRRLNNLGNSYMRRFVRFGELSDAGNAVERQTQAVQLTPDGHPDKPSLLYNLGSSYMGRYDRLHGHADLKCAHSTFQHGAQLILTSPEQQLRCGRNWANTCSLLALSPQEAYERCMELVPNIVWLGATVNQRYTLLINISDLAMEAASWAISAQSYDLAIEWLEEGRSIMRNQILQLQTPFDDLSTVDAALASHLKLVASQLEASGSREETTATLTDLSSELEKAAQRHRQLAAEWERCLYQARGIPGFENFMRPRKAPELKLTAKDGLVVLINTHATQCDALIVFPQCDDVTHVPLPLLSLQKLAQTRTQFQTQARQ